MPDRDHQTAPTSSSPRSSGPTPPVPPASAEPVALLCHPVAPWAARGPAGPRLCRYGRPAGGGSLGLGEGADGERPGLSAVDPCQGMLTEAEARAGLRQAVDMAYDMGCRECGGDSPSGPVPSVAAGGGYAAGMTMDEVQRDAARAAVEEAHGNRARAARALGVSRSHLYRLLSK